MQVQRYDIEGLALIKPKVFRDHRGFFLESYNKQAFEEAGISCEFVQDNHSLSSKGILRGLHYQINRTQAKLVRCVEGAIYDVAVDIRPGSPTYGQWVGELLTEENHHQLFVPKGFAHGFQVVSERAQVFYKCDDFYSPQDERGVIWSDPTLNIDWPDRETPILSDKDRVHPTFEKLTWE